MQHKFKKSLTVALLVMVVVSISLFSFFSLPGGDHFEVYLNKKLVLQQYVSQATAVKTFSLDERHLKDQVDIYYSHCGKIGNKRTIVIRDGKTILKQWRYAENAGNKFMLVAAKDILSLQKKGNDHKLNMYYSSEEIPGGKLLVVIDINSEHQKALP